MVYIYDIVLNLTDDSRILEFFEWNQLDNIEHIKKIPLFRVNTSFIDDLINYEIKIDEDILKKIRNLTELFDIKNKKIMEYVCLFSDGSKVIAVEFSHLGKAIYRSGLLLDEEEEILDIVDNLDITNIKYKKIKSRNIDFFLTRHEFFIKNYLLKELKSSYKKKDINKIKYLYEECFTDKKNIGDNLYDELVYDIDNNFSSRHVKLFEILTNKKIKK